MRLAGVDDRDAADAMRGVVFVIDSDELPPIDDPDEFYDHQLEGLAGPHRRRARRGYGRPRCCTPPRASCSPSAATDGGEVLVPFVSAIVTSVSLADRLIEIDPPEGLLELA